MGDISTRGTQISHQDQGSGPCLVLAHSFLCSGEMWEPLLPALAEGHRVVNVDLRGHGSSGRIEGEPTLYEMVEDVVAVLDHLGVERAVWCGLSIGGMIAQGLAVKRLDQVRALVLSNTGTKIGTKQMWEERIAQIRAHGLDSVADATMERWFGAAFRDRAELALWRNMLTRQPLEGYLGCVAAIGGTDFYTPTSGLRLPTLGIAGDADGATPPDLVRETVDLIPGSTFRLIRGAGHLPSVDQPAAFAQALAEFLRNIGHT